jgi:hypothetical protein
MRPQKKDIHWVLTYCTAMKENFVKQYHKEGWSSWICSLTGIVGSNPAGGMDVCLLWVLCVVRLSTLADHSSRGALLRVVCPSVIVKPL